MQMTVVLPLNAYDAVGNRTQERVLGTYSHNAGNQLVENSSYTYTYDNNGNHRACLKSPYSAANVAFAAYNSGRTTGYAALWWPAPSRRSTHIPPFSWGNEANPTGWNFDAPEDIAAANLSLTTGKGLDLAGGYELDDFVSWRAKKLANQPGHKWVPWSQCKTEAHNLIEGAKSDLFIYNLLGYDIK